MIVEVYTMVTAAVSVFYFSVGFEEDVVNAYGFCSPERLTALYVTEPPV
jgi:hypothetical protein